MLLFSCILICTSAGIVVEKKVQRQIASSTQAISENALLPPADTSLPTVSYWPFLFLLVSLIAAAVIFETLHLRWSNVDFSENIEKPEQSSEGSNTSPLDLRRMAHLILPYFRSKRGRKRGRLFVGILIFVGLINIAISYMVNRIISRYWDAIEKKDWELFLANLSVFVLLVFSDVLLHAYNNYLTNMFLIDWRTYCTERYQRLWLSNHTYYRIQMLPGPEGRRNQVDNPDQRIAVDLNNFTTASWTLFSGFLESVGTMLVFLPILWQLSPPHLPGTTTSFPGWLLHSCVLYCLVGSAVTHLIGQKLILVQYCNQRYEADYRTGLVRVGSLSESIALTRSEQAEGQRLNSRFQNVRRMIWETMFVTKRLNLFRSLFHYGGDLFPLFILSPAFFAGTITLGKLNQTFHAVRKILSSMQFFVGAYSDITAWRAAGNRVSEFESIAIMMAKKETFPPLKTVLLKEKPENLDDDTADVLTTMGNGTSDEMGSETSSMASIFDLRIDGRRDPHNSNASSFSSLSQELHADEAKPLVHGGSGEFGGDVYEEQEKLRLRNVTIYRPLVSKKTNSSGSLIQDVLLKAAWLTVKPGEWVLISGKEGSGKTSLLRAMAGVWPYVAKESVMLLPASRPRILFVTSNRNRLREEFSTVWEAVLYNVTDGPELAKEIHADLSLFPNDIDVALRAVGLSHVLYSAQGKALTPKGLSAGEAQRLELASAILSKPDWLFLDEATCHMPQSEQIFLLRSLRAVLPTSTAVVSVSHTVELTSVHDVHYQLVQDKTTPTTSCLMEVSKMD